MKIKDVNLNFGLNDGYSVPNMYASLSVSLTQIYKHTRSFASSSNIINDTICH